MTRYTPIPGRTPPQTPWGEWVPDEPDCFDPEYIPGASLAFKIFMAGSWAVIAVMFAALVLS